MNKTNPRENTRAVIFMSNIASRKSEGLTASHSRGSDEYAGDSIKEDSMSELNCSIGRNLWTKESEERAVRNHGSSILDSLRQKKHQKRATWMWLLVILVGMIVLAVLIGGCGTARAEVTESSYYTYASCIKEGTSGICANGERLKDYGEFTAASWDYKFNTRIKVTRIDTGKSIIVRINDRGPSKRLYRKGRKIDLNLAAMDALGGVNKGLIKVNMERI